MIQSLTVVFSTQGKVKAGRRNAKRGFDEKITAVPPILNKVQTRSSKSRKISPERDEGLPVRKYRLSKGKR